MNVRGMEYGAHTEPIRSPYVRRREDSNGRQEEIRMQQLRKCMSSRLVESYIGSQVGNTFGS